MSKLSAPSQQELFIIRALRRRVLEELKARKLGKADLARLLDMYPSGAGGLLLETHWSLETAVRVADALGIDVAESVKAG